MDDVAIKWHKVIDQAPGVVATMSCTHTLCIQLGMQTVHHLSVSPVVPFPERDTIWMTNLRFDLDNDDPHCVSR